MSCTYSNWTNYICVSFNSFTIIIIREILNHIECAFLVRLLIIMKYYDTNMNMFSINFTYAVWYKCFKCKVYKFIGVQRIIIYICDLIFLFECSLFLNWIPMSMYWVFNTLSYGFRPLYLNVHIISVQTLCRYIILFLSTNILNGEMMLR